MKKFWMFSTLLLVLAVAAAAQTSAGAQSSTNANTGVSAGQQGASANAGVSNDTNASANPQGGSSSSATTAGTGVSSNSSLASGTTILATLNKSVDAKKVKEGDEIDARAAQNVVSNGSVVIPRGSKLIGHVTEVKAREKGQNESSLGIAFDKAVLKNGQEVPLQASIRAIAAAPNNSAATNSPMPDMGGMDSTSSTSGGMSGDTGPRTGGVGGATGPVGSTAGTVGNTAGNVGGAAGGAVNSTVNGAGRTAGNATGELATNSQGVIGLQGLSLNSQAGTGASGSIITSTTKNVKLDSGTQLVLQVTR
jgi:hypothetical protein